MSVRINFFSLLFLLILSGCATKETSSKNFYSSLLKKGIGHQLISGKVFVEGEIFFVNNLKQGGAYGTFYLSDDKYLLILRPPVSSEYFLSWEKGENIIKWIEPGKKRLYLIKLENTSIKHFPEYFLGLREEELSFKKNSLEGKYSFDKENLIGMLSTNYFNLTWKFKEITFFQGNFPEYNWDNFKQKIIELSF